MSYDSAIMKITIIMSIPINVMSQMHTYAIPA